MIFWLYHGDGGVGIAGWGYRLFGDRGYGRRSVLWWVWMWRCGESLGFSGCVLVRFIVARLFMAVG